MKWKRNEDLIQGKKLKCSIDSREICTTYFFLLISTSALTFENLSFSAHGFYINSDVTVTPVYDKALREFYHSNIDHMNFKDKVGSQELINEFIEESTDGKIWDALIKLGIT